jgi:hypothetical protein
MHSNTPQINLIEKIKKPSNEMLGIDAQINKQLNPSWARLTICLT